ncbi:unnamed protein product [Protopolystoma xenopodis]|uniref:Uncharacterized protein n=1 Tax=Protopolystoma xenopodis TaxID=117903 RepID=A0A3S4ZHY8_9PLAT|nr:unnamed protein product [Protopolystoma xenopodis]
MESFDGEPLVVSVIDSFRSKIIQVHVEKRPNREHDSLLQDPDSEDYVDTIHSGKGNLEEDDGVTRKSNSGGVWSRLAE